MKAISEGWSVVVAGAWNRGIFRPDWISGHLTTEKNIVVEVPVGDPTLPLRFSFDSLKVFVTDNALVVAPERANEASMRGCVSVAQKALNILQHTPIVGLCYNFKFLETDPPETVLELMSFDDRNGLAEQGWKIQSTVLKRTLRLNDRILNFSLTYTPEDSVLFDFNYHSDVKTSAAALDVLKTEPSELEQTSRKLMQDLYGLKESKGSE